MLRSPACKFQSMSRQPLWAESAECVRLGDSERGARPDDREEMVHNRTGKGSAV